MKDTETAQESLQMVSNFINKQGIIISNLKEQANVQQSRINALEAENKLLLEKNGVDEDAK